MSTKTLTISAFLFDMDGTLVDSKAIVERAWALWARRYSLDLHELLAYSHGRPTLATMQHFGHYIEPGKNWKAEADELQDFEERATGGTTAIPGALELLTQLADSPWAVVTSAPRKLAESRIAAAGLPRPSLLVPADEITNGKPDPEGFLKAAMMLGVQSSECVVFEDTPPGIEAGLASGAQVVGLLTTVPADRLQTTNVIRNYHDLRVKALPGKFELEILEFNNSPS